jgi:hypothetical protein
MAWLRRKELNRRPLGYELVVNSDKLRFVGEFNELPSDLSFRYRLFWTLPLAIC